MTKKDLLRSVAFLLVLCAVIYVLCDLFEHENALMSRRYETFYDLEKNTVDGIIVGTSGIDRYWMAAKAYDDHGMTVYPLSTDSQPAWLVTEVIDEALKYQDPKLVIIDIRPFASTPGAGNGIQPEIATRRLIDAMNFTSINRLQAIFKSVDTLKEIDPETEANALDLYFSFIKYHSRWSENNFSFDEMKVFTSKYMGFYILEYASVKSMKNFPKAKKTDIRSPLDPVCENALDDLLEYLKDKDFEVLFLNTPHYMPTYEAGRTNTVCDKIEEAGFKYLNYTMSDKLLNVNRDYYDDGHVNYYGAVTFTDMFANYLLENYDFTDYRDNEKVARDWEGKYENIKEKIGLLEYVAPIGKTPVFTEATKAGNVNVNWYPVDNAKGYQVYRNTEEGGRYTLVGTVDKKGTTWFIDSDIVPGETYYYMVRPYGEGGKLGLFSSTVSFTVEGAK